MNLTYHKFYNIFLYVQYMFLITQFLAQFYHREIDFFLNHHKFL